MLGRWHGWGAAGQLFDRPEFADDRARLQRMLGHAGYAAAARTTLNAHYTDARIIRPMWQALAAAGVTAGVVLEPGAGRGSFLAEAPESYRVLGVELDPATARVAQALCDRRHAVVQADFAEVRLNHGADAVIGNVPFGKYALFDREHNPHRRLSIHDHFIAKAVAALRPGGVAILVTSRYTLDKLDGAARAAIGEHADFIGAVRLPSSAHQAEAGTKVVTDVLVLRGRGDQPPDHAPGWTEPPAVVTEWQGESLDEPIRMSRYFVDHPERVLGRVSVGGGLYRSELLVDGSTDDLEQTLISALDAVAGSASTGRDRHSRLAPSMAPLELIREEEAPLGPLGRIERTMTGLFRRVGADGWERHEPPKSQRDELATLVQLRDLAESLVAFEANHDAPDVLVDHTRSKLRATWESYVARWGPINRVKVNEDTGARTTPQMGGFRRDPGWPRVAALEIYDQPLNRADPASILLRRVVGIPSVPEQVEDPVDALALSLGQLGYVDIDYIAALLVTTPSAAVETLGERVYLDPAQDQWVPAEEYLSGNVRAKRRTAQAAAARDPSLARNVAALAEVIPRDVTADELTGTLGAPWLPVELVQDFARSLCPLDEQQSKTITVAHSEGEGWWSVNAPMSVRYRMMADHEFGLRSFDALRLLEYALNGRSPVVTKPDPDGKGTVSDPDATAQAVDLAEDLNERFDTWLLQDDAARAARALEIFNEKLNAHVPRSYELAGAAIRTDGLRNDFVLRPHQRQAIARMVFGGNTLLAHPVGAGKTAEMICGAMTLRQLGMIRRPCFVVPNHLLAQFAADVVDLYPSAQVLTITKDDFNKKGRALFAARVRSHDWDAVVITHASFTRWPLSPGCEATALEAKLAAFNEEIAKLEALGGEAASTLTKKLEKRRANYEARLKENQAEREKLHDDHTFYFDQAGVDWIAVDEAHEFKNGEIDSQVRDLRGVPTGDAARKADDLASKLGWLRDARPGRPTVTFATATPVSNTAAELWVMGRYLRPELLDQVGVGSFDSFRLAFCDTVSAMELDVSGTKFRRVERLARYKNLPELSRVWGEFVDVVAADQLGLPRPELAGGKRRVVLVPRSPELAHFMLFEITQRADAIHNGKVEPEEDNQLKIIGDARLASFDWETFRGEREDDAYSTLVAAADNIASIYHDNKDRIYQTATGRPHPRPGAFQLVFSDLGTPKPGRTDTAYDRLRRLLVSRGIPAGQIGFVHEYDKGDKADEAKARFFAACRDGRIAVAMSSTPKMGMGTNVQDRLIAEHHLDCPWRPSDIEQREGRILRQGNQNAEVQIVAYATEQSFSVAGWQTIERKAGFVGQIMRADPNGPRSLEPDDAEALAYGEIKAIATGDPDFLKLATLEDDLARLERLQRGHHQEQAALVRREANLQRRGAELRADAHRLRGIGDLVSGLADTSAMTLYVSRFPYSNRGDAARVLAGKLSTGSPRLYAVAVGLGDERLPADWTPDEEGGGKFVLRSIDEVVWVDDIEHNTLVGALTRIVNAVEAVPRRVRQFDAAIADNDAQLERTRAAIGTPFTRADELRDVRHQVTQLRETLEERYADTDDQAPTVEGGSPEPAAEADAHDATRQTAGIDRIRHKLKEISSRSEPPGLAR